jgi:hypothetical protein
MPVKNLFTITLGTARQGRIEHTHRTKITFIIILNNFFIYSLNFIFN